MSILGPVIIIVLGCEDGLEPDPDEELELLPDPLDELDPDDNRLLILKGTGDADCGTATLSTFSSLSVLSAAFRLFSLLLVTAFLVAFADLVFLLLDLEGESMFFGGL